MFSILWEFVDIKLPKQFTAARSKWVSDQLVRSEAQDACIDCLAAKCGSEIDTRCE